MNTHNEIKQFSLQELRDWFYALPENEVFSTSSSNSGCGCVLTKFFRSKDINFHHCSYNEAVSYNEVIEEGEDQSFLEVEAKVGLDKKEYNEAMYHIKRFVFHFAGGDCPTKADIIKQFPNFLG